jgi:hypothetical protein
MMNEIFSGIIHCLMLIFVGIFILIKYKRNVCEFLQHPEILLHYYAINYMQNKKNYFLFSE